ncbi:LysR substrate-binding domain-containing protein [Novosphingobium malaysiense]|uniref:LysR substrate-binding domain-containing protein n=1 Tax=Novosphingobium malaysiense TaxID=1348853 RepID=UPI001E543DCB|nr:LysR substrate-binding domain-containing protein [Novosphingobium malaysiense]
MRYFVAVAETLHFGRAAGQLHISQPPLSRQIAALEKGLGVKLLERHSRKASLTLAGERFLADAKAVLASLDQACRNARQVHDGELGELTVGFMMHAARSSVPPLVKRFLTARPGVQLQLKETIPSSIGEQVLSGALDAGITFAQPRMGTLKSRRIYREPLILALYEGHRLAAAPIVSAAKLANEPLIATPADIAPSLRGAIDAYFGLAGLRPHIRLETQLQQTIVSLVAQEIGVALVPESLGGQLPAGVVLRQLHEPPEVEHVIVWHPGNLNPSLPPLLDIAAGFTR